MKELEELLKKYKDSLNKVLEEQRDFSAINYPYLDFNQDILIQFNNGILLFFERILNKLSLSNEELREVHEAFNYYRNNQDLDLSLLIVRDSKCLSFIETIKKLYTKVIEYKEEMTINYQREIKKYTNMIEPVDTIKGLFQSSSEIDINNLKTILSSLPVEKDILLNILAEALNHNLILCQKLKQDEAKEHLLEENFVEDTEVTFKREEASIIEDIVEDFKEEDFDDLVLEEPVLEDELLIEEPEEEFLELPDVEIDEKLLDSYIRKIDYLLGELLKNNLDSHDIYLIQARLVELKSNLTKLKEDFKLCNSMLDSDEEDIVYLQAMKEEFKINIQKCIAEIDKIETSIFNDEKIEELDIQEEKKKNLIFLNSAFKDIEFFKKSACSMNVIRKMYTMLRQLQSDNINIGGNVHYQYTSSENSPIPVMELKGVTKSSGAPRIFYQSINDQIIVLLLGIEGSKHDHNWFKNSIKARISTSSQNEYYILIDSFRLASYNPNGVSIYNKNLTNQEFLNELLLKYQEIEQEFFDKYHAECYDPETKKR